MSTFGENLIKVRNLKNVTQAALANGIGVSVKTIRRYEHEESLPDAEMIRRIAKFLDVTSDRLLRADRPEDLEFSNMERRMVQYVCSRLYLDEDNNIIFLTRDEFDARNRE